MDERELTQNFVIENWIIQRENHPEETGKEIARRVRSDLKDMLDEFRSDWNL